MELTSPTLAEVGGAACSDAARKRLPTWAELDGDARRYVCLSGRIGGLSTSEIAAVWHASRNAVIGILYRMKKEGIYVPDSPHGLGSKQHKEPAPMTPAKPLKPVAKPVQHVHVNAGGILSELKARLAEPPIPVIAREKAFEPLPGTTPIPLMECGPRNCRWAVDGVHGPSRAFCGQEKDIEVSFCKAHQLLAYQPEHRRRGANRIAIGTVKKAA